MPDAPSVKDVNAPSSSTSGALKRKTPVNPGPSAPRSRKTMKAGPVMKAALRATLADDDDSDLSHDSDDSQRDPSFALPKVNPNPTTARSRRRKEMDDDDGVDDEEAQAVLDEDDLDVVNQGVKPKGQPSKGKGKGKTPAPGKENEEDGTVPKAPAKPRRNGKQNPLDLVKQPADAEQTRTGHQTATPANAMGAPMKNLLTPACLMMMGQYEVNRSHSTYMMGLLEDMGRIMKEDFRLRHPGQEVDTPHLDAGYTPGEAEQKMDSMKVQLVENSGERGKGFGGRSLAAAARKQVDPISNPVDDNASTPVNRNNGAGSSSLTIDAPESSSSALSNQVRASSSAPVNPSRATEIFRTTGYARPVEEGGAGSEGQAPGNFWLPTIPEAE